jgi:hypothetical protein
MGSTNGEIVDRFPAQVTDFSLSFSLRVGTGSGAHPVSYSMGITGFFPGIKRRGLDDDDPVEYSAEVKNVRHYTSTSSCLHWVKWGI